MRAIRTFLLAWLLSLALSAGESEESGVEWTLTPMNCFPGDLVELKARMTRPKFFGLEVKLPESSDLHLVTRQPGVVEYHNGIYTQQATWVMQPTRAGVIELEHIKAAVKLGKNTAEIDLPKLVLNVKSHGDIIDTFEPERLPPMVPPEKDDMRGVIAIGISAFVMLVLWIVLRPKSNLPAPIKKPEPTLDDLRLAVEFGPIPTAMIEHLLANPAVSLPTAIRTALERTVYAGTIDHAALLQLLKEEEGR